jgi:hypothetical protein
MSVDNKPQTPRALERALAIIAQTGGVDEFAKKYIEVLNATPANSKERRAMLDRIVEVISKVT